jgi:5'-nucleotidase
MSRRPTVLLTNDDGIHAPGLKHVWNALKDHCDLFILAPAFEQSGVGACVSLRKPLQISPVHWEEKTPAWSVSGTPVDCVRMAINVVLERAPDLVVSGINKGSNSGRNIFFSGTVGGVIEAAIRNLPGIALSCENFESPAYAHFEPHIFPLVEYLLENPLPKGSFLNVTFPCSFKESHKGLCFAKQGLGYFKEQMTKGLHPDGWPYYWMGGCWAEHEEPKDGDVALLREGFITVVPVQVCELTNLQIFEERKHHFSKSLLPH